MTRKRIEYQGGISLREDRLKELLVSGLAGDGATYRLFLEKLSAHLRAYLRRRISSLPDEVEDLLQELLLAIHNQRHTYDPRQPLTAWVHAIARYKVIDLLRRRSRTEGRHEPLEDQDELFCASDGDAQEARYDLALLLAQLPDRQRLAIQYVKIDGASVAEAATHLGMSVSAVKVGIHRGLKALAATMRSSE
jgi:RNA polymerase sigma-70 factor, ECF subfamily